MTTNPKVLADLRRNFPARFQESFDVCRPGAEPSVGVEPLRQPVANHGEPRVGAARPSDSRRRRALSPQEYLDPWGPLCGGLAKSAHAAAAQTRQDPLDMLACTEAADAMIDAAAGVRRSIEVADFHLIDRSALRAHRERHRRPGARAPRPRRQRSRCVRASAGARSRAGRSYPSLAVWPVVREPPGQAGRGAHAWVGGRGVTGRMTSPNLSAFKQARRGQREHQSSAAIVPNWHRKGQRPRQRSTAG